MFETAELGRSISKKVYKKEQVTLRQELLELQAQVRRQGHSQVIVVFAGVDAAGKGETVNVLNSWMDPRWLITWVFDEPIEVERHRPEFWRYWLALPPRGRIGMFLSSWYSRPMLARVYGEIEDVDFDRRLDRIKAFENALAEDGAIILKFWMHLSQEAQHERLKALDKDPLTKARVRERDWEHWKLYDRFVDAAERLIMRTNTGKAPWSIVEGVDFCYRSLTVGTILRDTLRRRLDEVHLDRMLRLEMRSKAEAENEAKREAWAISEDDAESGQEEEGREAANDVDAPAHADVSADDGGDAGRARNSEEKKEISPIVTVLTRLDMSQKLPKPQYQVQLSNWQAKLHRLQLSAREKSVSTVLVFEGPDAAGKGGAIRRLTIAMDASNYTVHGFAAPTDEEAAQHYLWRFWRRLQRAGRFTIFDRSWYGRVLVERVEGIAMEDEWRRAYAEINDFEAQLIEHGIVLLKFWIHITKAEQLRRFRQREQTPHKRWKLTAEDWRNRENWDKYELAVNDMVQFTSTPLAPWILVEGEDKRLARVKVIQNVCEKLEGVLG